MAMNQNPDRNSEYMRQMWGTSHLITDYVTENTNKTRILQEIMHDDIGKNRHNLTEQANLHEKIRNDDDYDDWEYGTEPVYGKEEPHK
jgi:hypothetical protein